jgi:Tol biopolymer transport system component
MIEKAAAFYQSPVNQVIENLGPSVNSSLPDYVPVISASGDDLFFTSRRNGGTTDQKDPNGDFFEDVYFSKNINGHWTEAVNLGNPVNTSTHDAAVAIAPSGNQLLIYRTNEQQDAGDIYVSSAEKEGWSTPELLSEKINSRYFEPSACFSPDEQSVYFASNRPGGFGGKDLYRVVKLPDGNWSDPVNLGPDINTAGHEDAPFISADGKYLLFSSTGHGSIGGYDVFKAVYHSETGMFTSPVNIGHPVNTVFDDIYLVLDASGSTGYYSTNRKGGFGGHDIYKVTFNHNNSRVIVKGMVTDENGLPVRAEIALHSDDYPEEPVVRSVSNRVTGKFLLILEPGTSYVAQISAVGFETLTREMQYEGEPGVKLTEVETNFTLQDLGEQSAK